jgi:hypothetical protein
MADVHGCIATHLPKKTVLTRKNPLGTDSNIQGADRKQSASSGTLR